ncbi:hypothetical protein WICPIJ_003826 [Wickerhamomyces pijperi]|uniref:Acyl carrier protein n=1 Tax=Wickerhamomyces pijperi TaxID=599730 RepID=A0A9P8Q8X2_WICPI|nr:hypothetical protein WICPIJ_003826 [Wickerhamomyces pijperi]
MFRSILRLPTTRAISSTRFTAASATRFYSTNGLTTSDILRRIQASNSHLIQPTFGELTAETTLAKDLGLDSLDSTEFLVNVENEFDFQLSDEQSEKVKTVGQIVELVANEPNAS